MKAYKDGSLKAVYRKRDGASVQKMNTSLLNKRVQILNTCSL